MTPLRLAVRLALLFILLQAVAVAAVLLAVPPLGTSSTATGGVLALLLVDLGLLAGVAAWIASRSVATPVHRLAADVQRIADGDYHHRVGDPRRPELREIRDSVNRLADRLIADQRRLAENVESLDQTNRELRQARDQIVHSARMASVGTLAAGIAHEVGNPLGAIVGFVDVARRRAEAEGADVELLDSIRGEAKRIDRIVRGLLDYARPPEGDGTPLPAEEVLGRVRRLMESQGALDGIEVRWMVTSGGSRLLDDPHRLEQVLVNLLLNAEHAVREVEEPVIEVRLREEDGTIRTLPRRREDDPPGVNYMHRRRRARDQASPASADSADRVTILEVADNGTGLPDDTLERVFDPFFTTKEPGEGTGLGLSICARLVEGMGGRIHAENRREGGARFLVRLPALYDRVDGADEPRDESHPESP